MDGSRFSAHKIYIYHIYVYKKEEITHCIIAASRKSKCIKQYNNKISFNRNFIHSFCCYYSALSLSWQTDGRNLKQFYLCISEKGESFHLVGNNHKAVPNNNSQIQKKIQCIWKKAFHCMVKIGWRSTNKLFPSNQRKWAKMN